MSTAEGRHIVLFRGASSNADDPYERTFGAAGYVATSRPVLAFEPVNEGRLAKKLGAPSRYSGLILTSPRAADYLGDALQWLPGQVAAWEGLPAYAVGPRTGSALAVLGFRPQGHHAGNAEALAAFIRANHEAQEHPLLFVCGVRRRPTIERELAEAGMACEAVPVYATKRRTDLDLSDVAQAEWLAFFSPSGVEAVQAATGIDPAESSCAAIGPTTAAALRQVGWSADAVASSPSPKGLLAAVQAAQ